LSRFEEQISTNGTGAKARRGRVHEAAAAFHDERGVVEHLDAGQGFQQRPGFGDEVVHVFEAQGAVISGV
jgi:hypothetical protein